MYNSMCISYISKMGTYVIGIRLVVTTEERGRVVSGRMVIFSLNLGKITWTYLVFENLLRNDSWTFL